MHLFFRRALLLLAPFAAAYPPPKACTGWCFKDLRDPNVVVKDGTYYRFTTHNNFTISVAPSISGPWKKQGSALHNGSMIDLPTPDTWKHGGHGQRSKLPMLWAPDVYLIEDTYYLTYTVTRGGAPNEIGVATSQTLESGSWIDHGSIELPENENSTRIDSNLLQTEPGSTPLLAFGSYRRGLYQVPFSLTSLKAEGDPVEIAHNSSNIAMEASFQFPWTIEGQTFYYLFFSSGRCCNSPSNLPPEGNEYKTMVCRSDNPTGPFVDDVDVPCTEKGGKMVLGSQRDVYGPGGQGVYYDEQLESPVMYYHYMNKTTGYKVEDVYFGWNKLSFDSGWPVVVGEGDDAGDDGEGDGWNENGSGQGGKSAAGRVQAKTLRWLGAVFLVTVVM